MCNHPLRVSSTPFAVPLFSWSYELLFPQALYFDKDLRCYGCVPCTLCVALFPSSLVQYFQQLANSFSLFALFFCTRVPLISAGYRLFCKKHRGYGGSVDAGDKPGCPARFSETIQGAQGGPGH